MSKYNIQIASNLSGVGTHTLRAWEKRYQAIVPNRSETGRRLYSDEDIEKLQLLSELCTLGNSIGAIANKPKSELQELLRKLGRKNFSSSQPLSLDQSPLKAKESLENLFIALEHFKLDILSHEIGKLKITLSARDFSLKILSPLLDRLNEGFENKSISPAQKSSLLSIIKFHIGHIVFKSYEQKSKNPITIAIASTGENDSHLSSMLSALLCSHYNINFFYLGESQLDSSLLEASNTLGADLIVVGQGDQKNFSSVAMNSKVAEISSKLKLNQKLFLLNERSDSFTTHANVSSIKTIEDLDKHLKDLI
ncbi:MerR family transcriptional regulator [Halobacteriovorax sp. HLS]|uniref:MerR family transcriptional regulator n=1 Tax=Halobacteriovorax sp. HLS TaxID=2234000 RepID=UPI000FDA9C3E|nr:MerR family transcriptional regulator [Halobacteriovorax sp. HLS]